MKNQVVIYENFRPENHKTQVHFQKTKQTSRCAVVCLGLVCAVLLAGNIGQIIIYVMNISPGLHDYQLQAKGDCDIGWTKFNGSCYMVSSGTKTWRESRRDCMAQGADLVTINSRDEQAFVNGLLRLSEHAWIGLTNTLTEEWEWEWVDHTPVTATFRQPNRYSRYSGSGLYCGELIQTPSIGKWNAEFCFYNQVWICEKK